MKLFTEVRCVTDINGVEIYNVWLKEDGFLKRWYLPRNGENLKGIKEAVEFALCPGLSENSMNNTTVVYLGEIRKNEPLAVGNLNEPLVRTKKKPARVPEVQEGFLPSEEKQDSNLNLKL